MQYININDNYIDSYSNKYNPIKAIKWIKSALGEITAAASACYLRQSTRKQLLSLSKEQLADIGISKKQAELEAGKPFWK